MTFTIRFWRQIQINFCSLSAEHKNKIKILHGKNQLTKKGVCTKLLSTQGNDCVVLGRQLAKQIEKQRRPFSAAIVEINTWRNMNWAFFPRNILTEKSTIEVLQFNNDSNLMWRLAKQKTYLEMTHLASGTSPSQIKSDLQFKFSRLTLQLPFYDSVWCVNRFTFEFSRKN